MTPLIRTILRGCGLLAVAALAVLAPSAYAAGPPDFSAPGEAWNVLPPGEAGSVPPTFPHSFDQLGIYDGLTPLFDTVTNKDLATYFKPNVFGLVAGEEPERSELNPRYAGLKIERDHKGVAHVFGKTRAEVMYGAGWVAYEDRALLMEVLRGPGRLAAVDAPGIDPFRVALEQRRFIPTAATEAFLAKEITILEEQPGGKQVVEDIDNYLKGINDLHKIVEAPTPEWSRNDVIAVAALIGARFGVGGGDEARRAQFLSALQQRLGSPGAGRRVFNDLREQNDPEAPVSVPGTFQQKSGDGSGNAVIDAGSIGASAVQAAASAQSMRAKASNALLLGASHSQNGHSLFVAGPQVGYLYPQVLNEIDLHGGGIDARGAGFPGSGPYVELGRGADFSWSATSSSTDIVDQYVETLCGSDTKYMFNGNCMEMSPFTAGSLTGPGGGPPLTTVAFNETVHGPVSGYARSHGQRVAISSKRSTRGRELTSALGFADLNDNAVHDPASFIAATSKIDYTFNWFYADNNNIAMFSSGRVPIRADGVDLGLPTVGTGQFEWQGFLPATAHPQAVNPSGDAIINWNNKPAAGWTAADNNWGWGAVQRVQLLRAAVARNSNHTLGSLVAAMNRAATQDLRDAVVLPAVAGVLRTGPAPSPREQQMLALLEQWRTEGSSRLDRNNTGKITAPGAAIMDKAWPKIANAVMAPVLGPQLEELASLIPRDNPANRQGSSYGDGWYGYVYKDLRALLAESGLGGNGEESGEGQFKTRFCGLGDLNECRKSLWTTLKEAGDELAQAQGTNDPTKWQADAGPERIRFAEGFPTMRWTNRPTFQQAISFAGHR